MSKFKELDIWMRIQEQKRVEDRKELDEIKRNAVSRDEFESFVRKVRNYLEHIEGQTEAAKIMRCCADERGGKLGKRTLSGEESGREVKVRL